MTFLLMLVALGLAYGVGQAAGWLAGTGTLFLSLLIISLLRGGNSERNLEFHDAWYEVVGPPESPDWLSANRYHRSRWKLAKKEDPTLTARAYLMSLSQKAEDDEGQASSLIGKLVRNPEMDEEQLRAAHATQQVASAKNLEVLASHWPDRNQYDWPMIRGSVFAWQESSPNWEVATLEAVLSPGVMTKEPNFSLSVESTEGLEIGSGVAFLIPRPDLRLRKPCYELRWQARGSTSDIRAALLGGDEPHLDLLCSYLHQRWMPFADDAAIRELVDPKPRIRGIGVPPM